MKFFGREKELERLHQIEMLSQENAQFTIITGRRRIGKTALVKEAYGNEMLYFFVVRKAEAELCRTYLQEISVKLHIPLPQGVVNSFAEVFRFIMELSTKYKFTLFIDEFQDFLRINPSIYSEMQNIWDQYKSTSKINLIVAGSVNTLMNKIFRDKKEPLYGRQTQGMNIKPLSTYDLKKVLETYAPDYQKSDLLALYAITGGVPKYVELLVDQKNLTEHDMIRQFFMPDSFFLSEGKNILIEEFGKDYGIYFSILTLIAEGANTRGDIVRSLGEREISGYLQKLLVDYGLIAKCQPLFEKSANKNVRYAIDDQFLRFWFRYVYKFAHIIEANGNEKLMQILEKDFSTFSGHSLEHYFIQKFKETGEYTRLGYWHDRKGHNEIDLIAEDELAKTVRIIEIKRQEKNIDLAILRAKTDIFIQSTGVYRDYDISYSGLSIADM